LSPKRLKTREQSILASGAALTAIGKERRGLSGVIALRLDRL